MLPGGGAAGGGDVVGTAAVVGGGVASDGGRGDRGGRDGGRRGGRRHAAARRRVGVAPEGHGDDRDDHGRGEGQPPPHVPAPPVDSRWHDRRRRDCPGGGRGRRATGAGAVTSVARRAARIASADAKRSPGSSASAVRIAAATGCGTSARTVRTSGGPLALPGEGDLQRGAAGVRLAAGQHLEQQHAGGVDVDGGCDAATRRAARARGSSGVPTTWPAIVTSARRVVEPLGDAEVGELGGAVGGEQDVARLHVAVHDAGTVGGGERLQYLVHDAQRLCRRRAGRRARGASGDGLAVDELHDDEEHVVGDRRRRRWRRRAGG